MLEPKVTLVVVPRERFSCARRSLESIYQYTKIPFKLVYIDGNSPTKERDFLKREAHSRNFDLIRTDYYLSPNCARNMGLSQVTTEYLVFIDNDVIVSEGWLAPLIQCADETGADVVGPLVCQNEPVHEVVHCAGGEARIWVDKTGKRRLREKLYSQGKRVDTIKGTLHRMHTELVEFHCVLIRNSVFDKIGPLDESLLNTREHVDLCLLVHNAGGKVYLEPNSLVTYVPGPPLDLSDVPFYMLRWSDAWERDSLNHLREKWQVTEDGNFQARYRRLGWRRYMTLFEPFADQVMFGWDRGSRLLARVLGKLDHVILNPYLTSTYARRQKSSPQLQNSHRT